MNRYVLFVCVVVCTLSLNHVAGATTVDANLSLDFTNPNDAGSGGNWTVSALAGDFGLAGISFDVVPSNFAGTFLISNTVFEVQQSAPDGSGTGFIFALGDDLVTPTLNVGVGSSVGLVTGTFDPGFVPALLNVDANLFTAAGGVAGVAPSNLTTSLTTNLVPEPTTLTLIALALLGTGYCRRKQA
jgi:hypothetical protein